jgi:mercuric ion binding protein
MKAKYFFLTLVTFCSFNLFAQSKTDTVKVWGICEECKGKIETAAKKAGALSADWNEDNYLLVVNYNSDKTSAMNIQKEIAAVGYDTQDVKATDDAYNKLPKCCQYTRGDNAGTKQE